MRLFGSGRLTRGIAQPIRLGPGISERLPLIKPENPMPTFGSPFKHGTLSSVILGVVLVLVMIYFYVTSPAKKPIFLFLIFLASLSTIGSYFRYQKLSRQKGNEFIGDSE